MKHIKLFEDFMSLAHGFSGGSGAPAYGLGGPNYGEQQLRPSISKQDTSFLYSEYTGQFYSNEDILKIYSDYKIWCLENQEEPIIKQITDLTSSNLDQILMSLGY
jgi:hypothetical protein